MTDQLIRGIFPEKKFRFSICQAAGVCGEAVARHQSDALSGWLLSEALTCGVILSVGLKGQEKMTLRWIYDGPVGEIMADTSAGARVRGYTQRVTLMNEHTTLGQVVGDTGRIAAISSLPDKVLHTGITESVFQEIPRDIGHLLSLSFQVESAVTVGLIMPPKMPLEVISALGVLVQPLPGADLEAFQAFRQRVESPDFRAWLESGVHAPESVLEKLARDEPHEMLGSTEPEFFCECNREKVVSVLRMFEPEEMASILEEKGKVEVHCHFCGEAYTFDPPEVQSFMARENSGHA